MGRRERHVAWSLCVLYRDILPSGYRGGIDPHCLDRDRLSPPETPPARARRVRCDPALRAKRCGDPMSESSTSAAPPPRRSWLMALPLVAFVALAAIFWFRLGNGDPSRIPSALIGHPAPQTALPPLAGLSIEG